jgi:protein-disulfide isomerase
MSEVNSKKNFYFGLVSGIAVVSIIAFIATLAFLFSDKDSANNPNDNNIAAAPTPTRNTAPQPTAQPTNIDIEVTKDDHIKGEFDAPITIIEFSDFQCPYCSRFHQTMRQVADNYKNQVRWVYKHFPLDSIHPYARKAAEASECAGDQNKFWEYTDELFVNQSLISPDFLKQTAIKLGLNENKFNECLDSGKYSSKVESDYQQGLKAGVTGTPGNIINGQLVPGALPYEQMQGMIDSLL